MKDKNGFKKILRTIFFILCLIGVSAQAWSAEEGRSHQVLVSVAPHKCFVEKIAGDTVDVILMVPAGASAHTYEPTPKQMLNATKADIWFYVGEGFEARVKRSLESYNSQMRFADMRTNVNLITFDNDEYKPCSCCKKHSCYDLHYWLSPRQAKAQAETIAKALIECYPENAELYRNNLNSIQEELTILDRDIIEILKRPHNPVVLVSHPAYAYFCRDYGVRQLPIEIEGKDPTPGQLTKLLEAARFHQVKRVFVQVQYSSKGARLVAAELGACVVDLNPYAEQYFDSLREIARAFSD